MIATDFGFATIAAVLLLGIAWSDATRLVIEPWAGLALAVTGIAWHTTGTSDLGVVSRAWWMPLLGLACGLSTVALPIAAAPACRRRWPLMPGDGVLLGGVGACLGPLGLAWALFAGAVLSTAHRMCLQRKRRRPWTSGYAPLGPGMAGGALIILALVAGGHAVAHPGATCAGVHINDAGPARLAHHPPVPSQGEQP